jgi:nitrogen fixation NifU-like protein
MVVPVPGQEDLRSLYRELVLDHARSPRHFGKLDPSSHRAEGINPLCGDKLKVYFQIDQRGHIEDARFEGSGCAISVASASLMTETVIGLKTAQAMEVFAAVIASLSDQAGLQDFDLGELAALQGVREFPARVKCATLAWHALDAAIHHDEAAATTE